MIERRDRSLLALVVAGSFFAVPALAFDGVKFKAFGAKPRLNREIQGPVTDDVQGVPAAPVDSMVWDGRGSRPIVGAIFINVDPVLNQGEVFARWADEHGTWTYRQDTFIHPHHISGVRLGRSIFEVEFIVKDAIINNAHLHGDSGAGPPVMPTVFAYLAAWGPAEVTLNDQPFENVYDGPLPLWMGHLMVTHGVRRPDGTVRAVDGTIYDPSKASQGDSDPSDLEIHLTFHDQRFPSTQNIPPDFSFFYHIVFEDVVIQLGQLEDREPR